MRQETPAAFVPDSYPGTARSRLKVLAIDEEVPLPPDTGKRIRTWNLLNRLSKRHEVTLLCYGNESIGSTSELRDAGIRVELVDALPELSGPALYLRLLKNLFSKYPYSVDKHHTERFATKLQEMLSTERFDVLHCEWTPYARYLAGVREIPTVLATHNIESQIWERRAEQASNVLARLFFRSQYKKMLAFELRELPEVGVVTAVSAQDAAQIHSWGIECTLVENGVDLDQFSVADVGDPGFLLFVGSLDWFPNRDAVEYMVREILPSLRRATPKASLHVVGRRPPADFVREQAQSQSVEIVGDVPDVRPYLQRAGIVVVPLRIGGGSRIKILEALATGKAVVSTSIGAEGLEVTHGENIMLADSPADFVTAVIRLQSGEERSRLGRNGRRLVERRYSWDRSAAALEQAWLAAAAATNIGVAG